MKNDDVSAISVPKGWRVTIYEHAGYKGRSRTFTGNVSCLGDFNDEMSSIRVEKLVDNSGRAKVTGNNVVRVDYGTGAFVRSGPGWLETKKGGAQTLRFSEVSRNASKVSLYDSSRNVSIVLDLPAKKVLYGQGSTATRSLYTITGTSSDDPTLYNGKQCVEGKFGVGYVGVVRWYWPADVLLDPTTQKISLRSGAKPYRDENVPVFQSSCVETGHKMFAQVAILAGDFANDFVTIAAGTVVGATTGVAGAFICVGTAGAGCGLAAAGVSVATGLATSAVGLALPDASKTLYFGSPKKLGLYGTIWNASTEEL